MKFRNAGTKPAEADYSLFVHFETAKDCRTIAINADHPPADPTSQWQPGQMIVDGPRVLTAPGTPAEQEYFLHVGVFDPSGRQGRLLDTYVGGKLRVSRQAPSIEKIGPPRLASQDVAQRRGALAARIKPASEPPWTLRRGGSTWIGPAGPGP